MFSMAKEKKKAGEAHNCLRALVKGTGDHNFANSPNLYQGYAQASWFCQTLHKCYLSVLNWQCLQYKDISHRFVFSRELRAAQRGNERWMLFVYPQKTHPRHCEYRLSSSDLGKWCQGLSGSFNPCPLSRQSPPADQLTVGSDWGLLSENWVRGH